MTAVAVREPEPTFRCLHEAVGSALGWLGASDGEVIASLEVAGVAGWPGHPMMDPICRWLAGAIPELGVQLEGDRLRVWLGSTDTAVVPLPEPARGALARIAAGDAPALLLDPQPPLLPGPDLQDAYPRSYLEQLYPLVAYPADEPAPEACTEVDLVDEVRCRVCGCTEDAPCEVECVPDGYGSCYWVTDEELLAAGVEPMLGDVCSACILVAAGTARLPAPMPAAEPEAPPARQRDTVTIPAVPAAAGDRGSALVRFAVAAGAAAAGAFLLAAVGAEPWLVPLAVSVPGMAGAAWIARLRRCTYAARHRPGHRPAHAAPQGAS